MKKLLTIIILVFLWSQVINAASLTCRSSETNKTIKVFYDQDKIKAVGKTFEDVFVFGTGISGEYYIWESNFLGLGKKIVESWRIVIEFESPKTAIITGFKYKNDKAIIISDTFYYCK